MFLPNLKTASRKVKSYYGTANRTTQKTRYKFQIEYVYANNFSLNTQLPNTNGDLFTVVSGTFSPFLFNVDSGTVTFT